MKIVAIIQARMTSNRLPGKVLLPIRNQPLLAYSLNRVKKASRINQIIVATTTEVTDNAIVAWCKETQTPFYRGRMEDVLSRYYETAKISQADIVIRITADCPLVDGSLINMGISEFNASGADYLSNTIERTFPRGFDFEIFTFAALENAYLNAKDTSEREHVTPYIYKTHPEEFKINSFRQKENQSKYQITVDTLEDYKLLKILIEKYSADNIGFKEIITILDNHPELVTININVLRKKFGQ